MSSNEKIIRELARDFLNKKYNGIVRDEFSNYLPAITDLLAINKKHIICCEIKSDRDNFTRLENQLNTYISYSTGVYVALDEKHYEKFIEKFVKKSYKYINVGILVYENKTKKLILKKEIPYYKKFPFLYNQLSSQELSKFFDYFKGKSLIPKNEETSKTILEDIFSYKEIYNISKELFLNKFTEKCSFDKSLINDFEYKQNKFNEWLEKDKWNLYEPKTFKKGKMIPTGKIVRSSIKKDSEENE